MAVARPLPVVVPRDPASLAVVMDELAAAQKGWINLLPEIPEDVPVPATPNALAVFSKRGPFVPLGTWTAPTVNRNGSVNPAELGIQHAAARQAKVALTGTIGRIPSGWVVISDHPRRGVVVRPPAGTPHVDQAQWLLDALTTLCLPPQTGNFQLFRYE